MSNEITAYFKGRSGVAESVYQYDYGMVLVLDGIELPENFDCYFSNEGDEEAIPSVGAENRVAIPNKCLRVPGIFTVHIPTHSGLNDSEVEYVVSVKVINRAKPSDDGTEADQTAISQAIAALNHNNLPGLVPDIVTEWLDNHPEATTTVQDKSIGKVKLTDDLVDEILFDEDIEIFTVATPIRAYCTALIDSNGRCILLDLSSTTITITPTASMTSATDLVCDASAPYVIEALRNKITNVDAVVLSHYHYDHMGNLETLFGENGLPCENTKFFLPKIPNVIAGSKGVSQAMHDAMIEYNDWLTEHGFSKEVPDEGQVETINGIKFTFHNCDADYWEDLASSTDYEYEYNDTSICTLVEYGEGRFYSVGDAYWNLQKWLVDNEYVEKANILLAPHHGLAVNIYPEFITSVSPDVVIGQFGNTDLLNEFVANKYPSIPSAEKTEVANKLNMYIPYRTYFSAASNWCEEAGIPYVDTIDNSSFSMKLCQSGTVMWEGIEPFVADGIVKTYASPRDALMHNEFISDSQTGVWDLLKNMPANSQIICYMTNAFQFVKDLKLPFYNSSTTRTYLVAISKFVGASRNHSEYDPAFYFTIDVTYYQGGNCDDRLVFVGKCNGSGVLTADFQKYSSFNLIYMGGTADASTHIYDMTANASRSFESSLFTLSGTTFKVLKSGMYRVTMTGTNINDTIVLENTSGTVKTTHVLTPGSSNTQIALLVTSETYRIKSTNATNALTVWIEWMGLTSSAEFPSA